MSYGNCLNCNEDVSQLMNFDTLCQEFIACPKCGHKMIVEFDDGYDDKTNEENHTWWLENYKEQEDKE